MINNRRLKKKRCPITTLGIVVITLLLALIIIVAYWLFLYLKHPSHIKNTDTIVNNSITKVIQEPYNSNYCPTRQEVLQITSNVFYELKCKDFEKTEDAKDTIQQAMRLEILQGDGSAFHLERSATKQESLVFIGRSLGITKDLEVEKQPDFLATTLFDDWAKIQINGLVVQGYLDTEVIDNLHNLRDVITIFDLECLLDHIVESITDPISFFDFFKLWLNNRSFSVLSVLYLSVIPATITILSVAIKIFKKKKESDESKQQKARRTGTICLAGTTSVGKTTLKLKMKDPATSIFQLETQMQPTRSCNTEYIRIRSYVGDIVFEGALIDVPGQNPEDVLQFLMSSHPNKILLLILAHTKAFEGDVDFDFVQEQLNDIQTLWTTTIRACKNNLSKIVVLINKIDLLPQESLPAEKYVYREHIKLLFDAAKVAQIPVRVVEISSTTGKNLNDLYQALRPDFI